MSNRLGNGYSLFLALLLPLQVRTAFEFDTETLRVAVTAWCQDEASAEATYGHISAWDTSRVKSFRGLFMLAAWEGHCSTAATFNADISNWDVSAGEVMKEMFSGAYEFNRDISSWDVSHAEDMRDMFAYAYSFNQDISQWDVSGPRDMNSMFFNAVSFNIDLSPWDVSGVYDAGAMFEYCNHFHQVLCWNLPERVNTDRMFEASLGSLTTNCPTPAPTFTYRPTQKASPQPSLALLPTHLPTPLPTAKKPSGIPGGGGEEASERVDLAVAMTLSANKSPTSVDLEAFKGLIAQQIGAAPEAISSFSAVEVTAAADQSMGEAASSSTFVTWAVTFRLEAALSDLLVHADGAAAFESSVAPALEAGTFSAAVETALAVTIEVLSVAVADSDATPPSPPSSSGSSSNDEMLKRASWNGFLLVAILAATGIASAAYLRMRRMRREEETPEEAERRRSRLKKWFLRRGNGRDTGGDTGRAEYAHREGTATASLQRSFEQSLRNGAHLQRSRGGGANARGNGGEDSGLLVGAAATANPLAAGEGDLTKSHLV